MLSNLLKLPLPNIKQKYNKGQSKLNELNKTTDDSDYLYIEPEELLHVIEQLRKYMLFPGSLHTELNQDLYGDLSVSPYDLDIIYLNDIETLKLLSKYEYDKNLITTNWFVVFKINKHHLINYMS